MDAKARTRIAEDYLRYLYNTYGEDAHLRGVVETELLLFIRRIHPFCSGPANVVAGVKLGEPTIVKSPPKKT